MTSLGAGFEVYEDNQSRLEAIAGLRHWDLDVLTTVLDRTFSTPTHWLERATVVL